MADGNKPLPWLRANTRNVAYNLATKANFAIVQKWEIHEARGITKSAAAFKTPA